MTDRASPLEQLSDAAGIVPGYTDQEGREWRTPSDATRRALLAAMGFDAGTDEAAERSLARWRARRRGQLVPPVVVVKGSDPAHRTLRVTMPEPLVEPVRWTLSVVTEEGESETIEGIEPGGTGHTLEVVLPTALPLGYHTIRVAVSSASGTTAAEQLRIVVPDACLRARELLRGEPAWGIVVNLYSLRSARNWGIGDVTDLAALAEWAAALGAQFVGLNPLHAIRNAGTDVSPYSPITRLFRNPAYIDVTAIPELATAPGAQLLLDAPALRAELEALRAAETLDYERVMRAKWPLFRACFDAAAVAASVAVSSPRWDAFREWADSQEPELTTFARHMVRSAGAWRLESTPAFDDPDAMDVEFHRWVQWELDRQLGEVCTRARAAGMRIGLYQDLAIGSSAAGSDAESSPRLFVRGVSVGAPPDPYSAHGQNWGFPPIDPQVLAAERYRYFIRLIRSGFRHAGALRIDHVMGLFRLFWIPEGKLGEHGAYVRYPAEDLLGILALESVRHHALVVGEDLGTVPPEVPPAMERWGVLSSKVLYFERDAHGRFRSTGDYPAESLATANTHDMATLIGFMRGRDVELRIAHGLVAPGGEAAARAARERDRVQLVDRLVADGVLDRADAGDTTAFRAAVHDLLAASPALLVGISLDDLAGEVEAVNLPGVGPEAYPAWQRRMSMSIEQLRDDPDVTAALGTRLAAGR